MTESPEATAAVRAGRPAPASVLALADGQAVRPVWDNAVGGRTFEVGAGERRRFVKWAPAASGLDLAAEAARLAWAAGTTASCGNSARDRLGIPAGDLMITRTAVRREQR